MENIPKYTNFSGEGRRKPPATECKYQRKHILRWVAKMTGLSMKKVDLVMRGQEEFFLLAASEGNGVNWNGFIAMRIYRKGDKWKSSLYNKVIKNVTYAQFTAPRFMRKAVSLTRERYYDSSLPVDIREETPFKLPLPELDLLKSKDKPKTDLQLDEVNGEDDMIWYITAYKREDNSFISKEPLPITLYKSFGDVDGYIRKLNREDKVNYYELSTEIMKDF
jgi:hypothetical protein